VSKTLLQALAAKKRRLGFSQRFGSYAQAKPLVFRFKEQGFFVLLWNLDFYILL
jgi:hypothetical protein